MAKKKMVKWGYGIIDVDGNAFMSEICVCEDKVAMVDVATDLNDFSKPGDPVPYRVVRLYYLTNKKSLRTPKGIQNARR